MNRRVCRLDTSTDKTGPCVWNEKAEQMPEAQLKALNEDVNSLGWHFPGVPA